MHSESSSKGPAAVRLGASRAGRAVIYVLETLALLLVATVGVMSTPWFSRALERQVVLHLKDWTGGRVEINHLHFNPLILQITVHGLVIHGSEPLSQFPLFVAKTVEARLSLVPLTRRKLRLRTLDWEDAEIHLITNRDGSTNFPGPTVSFEAGETSNEFSALSIGQLNLARTQIVWNDQRLPLGLDAQSVSILLRSIGGHRYAGSLSSFSTKIRASPWAPPPFMLTSQFELGPGTFSVKSLAWQSPGFRGLCSFNLRNPASPEGSFSFQTSVGVSELAGRLHREEARGGTINLEGRGNYREGQATVRGQVQARGLIFQSSLWNPGPVDLSADYLAGRRGVELSHLSVKALGGSGQGRASILFPGASPDFVVHIQVHGLDMNAALQSFSRHRETLARIPHVARIGGSAEVAWSGWLENLRSQFDFQFYPLPDQVPDSFPLSGHARGRAWMAPGFGLELQEVKFQTPQSVLSARGKLGPQSNLTFELVTSDFQEWHRLLESVYGVSRHIPLSLASPAILSGTVSGTLARPEVRARFESGAFQYGGLRWDGFSTNIVTTPDLIEVSSGHLRRGKSTLTVNASAQLDNWALAPWSILHLSAQAEKTPLEILNALLSRSYLAAGLATGHLDLEGTAANLNGGGALRIEQGTFAQAPFDWLSTQIRVAASVWNLENTELRRGPGKLAGEFRFDPSRRFFSTHFHGDNFSLADELSHYLLPRPNSSPSPWLDGRADFDLQGEGAPEDARLHSTWSIRDIRVEDDAIGDLQGQIEWQGKELRIEGRSQGPGGEIRFSGEARTEADWPLSLKGEYEDLRAETWIRLLLNRKLNLVVAARGSFDLTGPLKQPGRMAAQSQAENLEVMFPGLTWKNEHPVNLRCAQGTLTVSRFRMRGPSTDLEVEASIRFGEGGTLSLDAQGQAEAALLSLMDPALQAAGRSDLNLQVSGALSSEHPVQPLLKGALDVHDLSLKYGDLPFRISGLNGEIRLEGERATVNSLRGNSGGGSITLTGFVTLSENPSFDLRADLDQVRVLYPRDFTSLLNGSLRLTGTSERGNLRGELTVRQVFVSQNFSLSGLIAGENSLERALPGLASPLASKIQLNIQVNSGAPLRLETRDWTLLADLDVSLQGTLADPVEIGTLQLRSGEAFFRGNRYRLNRGEVRMSNPFRTQPLLDLEASTRVQRYDLTVDISGPFDRLKVSYRSDPPLPSEDVLSLLALGFSQQEAERSTVATGTLPTVQAGALLSQALSNQVTGRVQRLFGVSRIKVDPNVGGAGSPGGARVTFEQQVTHDLTLTYVTNTATSQYRIIQFEWAITDNTSLVGVRDQNGILGMELKFRRRFR